MTFEYYVRRGGKELRMGFTTGSCAALAAKAATTMLLSGCPVDSVCIDTPRGISVEVPVVGTEFEGEFVSCAVKKDAGDDFDVTDGILIFARVRKVSGEGVSIDGGNGVGRVTRPGIDQPVGCAAINSVPREMIVCEVQSVCNTYGYAGGIEVVVSVPKGEEIARKTFNPQLGIEGGISILGTSGIVEPQSVQALIDCIGVELRSLSAGGHDFVVLTPGNYGEDFLKAHKALCNVPKVKCSNYIGDALDFAVECRFTRALLVGHMGKLIKVAGGIMNTHSRVADCRNEIVVAHAALQGADVVTLKRLMECVSTDACVQVLDECGLKECVISSILARMQSNLERRVGENMRVGAVMFSNVYGTLGQTGSAREIISTLEN